jgi:transposase
MSRILKVSEQLIIQALAAKGFSLRRIARELGVNRRTVARYAGVTGSKRTTEAEEVTAGLEGAEGSKCTTEAGEVTTGLTAVSESKCTTAQGKVTAGSRSLCAPHAEFIEGLVAQGLTAQRIWQDLRAGHGFAGSYEAVKRFVNRVNVRTPERVWRVESQPGEELQVDFMQGPMVAAADAGGKRRRTWILRLVLSCSRKGYSEAVFRQDTESFLRALENGLRHFGGSTHLLNLDNLKAGVLKADWTDPEFNPKFAAFCRHYGMTPMPCRPYHPQHKGKVERSVSFVRGSALKGREFASLAALNEHLRHWEATVADTRIHGTIRRQVAAMFEQERPHLQALPSDLFPAYQEARRTVHQDGYVEVAKAYYEAPLEWIGRRVWVQWDSRRVIILNDKQECLHTHGRLEPGEFTRTRGVRGLDGGVAFNIQHWSRQAAALGSAASQWATQTVEKRGAAALRSIMGLCALARTHRPAHIDTACAKALATGADDPLRLRDVRRLLRAGSSAPSQTLMPFLDEHPVIRCLDHYGQFVLHHAEPTDPSHHTTTTDEHAQQPQSPGPLPAPQRPDPQPGSPPAGSDQQPSAA